LASVFVPYEVFLTLCFTLWRVLRKVVVSPDLDLSPDPALRIPLLHSQRIHKGSAHRLQDYFLWGGCPKLTAPAVSSGKTTIPLSSRHTLAYAHTRQQRSLGNTVSFLTYFPSEGALEFELDFEAGWGVGRAVVSDIP
jgi:hypothetical protein